MNHEQEKAKKLRKIARLAAQGITKVVEMFAILCVSDVIAKLCRAEEQSTRKRELQMETRFQQTTTMNETSFSTPSNIFCIFVFEEKVCEN